jgi:hypothetical protein
MAIWRWESLQQLQLRISCSCSSLGDDLIFSQPFVVPQANAYLRPELSGTLLTRRKSYFAFKIGISLYFPLWYLGNAHRKRHVLKITVCIAFYFFLSLLFTEIHQVWRLRVAASIVNK